MQTEIIPNQNAITRLISLIEAGGPEVNEYDEVTNIWNDLILGEETISPQVLSKNNLVRLFGNDFLTETVQGFAFRKPHGYSGDFEIIDFIYQNKTNQDLRFKKWDKYFYAQQACKALRNRKRYFIKLVKNRCSKINRPLRILNIASGPCRDLLELLEQIPEEKVKIHCVEMDPKAIQYAKSLLGSHSDAIEFTQNNIFRFNTDNKYDLIWSAGLFDYFDNNTFIKLLSKFQTWCAPSGEIVIGNFSVSNPSRSYMEKAGNWYLFHRTADGLRELAMYAGIKENQMSVRKEPLGINLFLHARVS
jgi:extracellular factor (EF) 3-hydroxypalmitic acid methyl ester biosynthesis protein